MSLNIDNEEAGLLAQELTQLTGETLTQAVVEALRERVLKVRNAKKRVGMAEDLLAIGRDAAAHWPKELRDINPDDLLYDDMGLPK